MRKTIIHSSYSQVESQSEGAWLNLEPIARVEVTSEHPNFPIESALSGQRGSGWRAAETGQQVLRIVFDTPRTLSRIRLEFSESDVERTQEFTLRWAAAPDGRFREIVRQQWNFSPQGATTEIEDYSITLDEVLVLELILKPDLTSNRALAALASWRVA
jgi:hypothetical protein